MWSRVLVVIAMVFALSGAVFSSSTTYVVQPGDTLYGLTRKCNCQIAQLKTWNNLKTNVLRVGQKLRFGPASARLRAPKYSVQLSIKTILGEPVAVVRVNLAHPNVRVRPILPRAGLGRGGALLQTLARRSGAQAAINGGFFHPRTYTPVGDMVVNGKHIARGRVRTAFAITWDRRARVVQHQVNVRRGAWRGYETVIGNGPYIVQAGQVRLKPRADGFHDPAVLGVASRSAVGVLNEREIILVSTKQKLSLEKLARVMKALGAREALVMDGGSSTSMTWGRKALIRPGRAISYGIGVFVKR